MRDLPILKLELECTKQQVSALLTDNANEISMAIGATFDRLLGDGFIAHLIDERVQSEIKRSLTNAVEGYYKYGEGKKFINALVLQRLSPKESTK